MRLMIEMGGYKVADPDSIETPAMLVFQDKVDENIQVLSDIAGGCGNIFAHVKTHKSEDITRKQVEVGIAGFKCATLSELEMTLAAGAKEVILAYPIVQRIKAERFADLVASNDDANIYAVVSQPVHVECLSNIADTRHIKIQVLLDIDVGMHRTGIEIGDQALSLYRSVESKTNLSASGLHIYDGHEHFSNIHERERAAHAHINEVKEFVGRLRSSNLQVERIVGGGSFSFPYYAKTEGMHGSPGTCIYWDTGYADAMPDVPFQWAALVLGQVVDVYSNNDRQMITTDLGLKAICGDVPLVKRARLLNNPQAELIGQSEEHGMFSWSDSLPDIGSYVLAIPGHVCPTTIRYPGSYVLDNGGELVDFYPHTARDRQ